MRGVQQRNLDPVHLVSVFADQGEEGFGGLAMLSDAPVPSQGRVEHGAQPVQDHRLIDFPQQRGVDVQVVLRRLATFASARDAIRMTLGPASVTTAICSR